MNINDTNISGGYISIGKQGSGKTLLMIKFLVDNLQYKNKVYSNTTLYNLDKPYTRVTLSPREDIESFKGVPRVLDMLRENHNVFNNSILLLDEIHLDLDSRDWFNANNRELQVFFSQLRKRKCLLLSTSQNLLNVDIRVRRQLLYVFDMKNIGNGIFRVAVNDIDGYYYNLISQYNINLSSYYDYYDTDEIVL